MFCCFTCSSEIVETLLDAGSQVNFANKNSDTPLHLAALVENPEMVKILLRWGADPNAINICFERPLHFTAFHINADIVKILKEAGAKLDSQNQDEETPLHLAILHNNNKVAKTLIELGANVNIQGRRDGNTPLHLAVQHRKAPSIILDLVTARGADVNIRNSQGNTPLHLIARQAEYGDIKNAVSFINAREIGQSCRRESSIIDIVRILMINGADPSIKNKRGKVLEHDSVTEFLEERSRSGLIQTPGSRLSNVSDEPIAGPSWQRN